jgi:hypothetical protein
MFWPGPGSQTKLRKMNDPADHRPRRYFVDENGRRVLIGLSIEETFEFETLDNLPAIERADERAAWEENGSPTTARERRWLELYGKHDRAWRQWMVETAADRRAS